MKKCIIYFLLFFIPFVQGCKKDNDNKPKKLISAIDPIVSVDDAILQGTINFVPNKPILELGFIYGKTEYFLNKTLISENVIEDSFCAQSSYLGENSTFYYRAFAVLEGSSERVLSDEVICFTTMTPVSVNIESVKSKSATITGSYCRSDFYLKHGVEYWRPASEVEVDTIETKVVFTESTSELENGVKKFVVELNSLEKGNYYYARTFVEDNKGNRTYSNVTSFSTKTSLEPIVHSVECNRSTIKDDLLNFKAVMGYMGELNIVRAEFQYSKSYNVFKYGKIIEAKFDDFT
ncbi:MAG: hypothetical protein ACEPOW_12835, partial [Bacteroidales bacterium]